MNAIPRLQASPAVVERAVCLIVDDEPVNRMVLAALLRSCGFEIIEAGNGEEACAICATASPDLIFMDIMMPVMDGFEATRRIKLQLDEIFVPIIFLTAVSDEAQLRRCIEVGGDAFLTKPFSRTLLEAKIESVMRVRAIHRDLARQRDALADYQDRQRQDLEVAKKILDNVATREELAKPNVRYLLRPLDLLNGDIILCATRPTGEQCFLVGDFTGHGLPAAIGAMTVHGVFMSMVTKGFGIDDIVPELNRKMYALLPVDRFLSAAFIELQHETGMLKIWNGGLPDIIVRNAGDGALSRFRSINLPLGIVAPERYTSRSVTVALQPGDHVLAYSDGLVEAHNLQDELFGDARVEAVLSVPGEVTTCFDNLLASLADHVGTAPQRDDISVLFVQRDLTFNARKSHGHGAMGPAKVPGHWKFCVTLDAAALKQSEPIATVMQVIDTVQGLGSIRTPLFTVLAELFSNALEHGVLGLDSETKQGPNGFSEYYEERLRRLEALQEATLVIDCRHEPDGDGGVLTIRVGHDGAGFDPNAVGRSGTDEGQFKGRGIRLVRSLCETLHYQNGGRQAVASYRWFTTQP